MDEAGDMSVNKRHKVDDSHLGALADGNHDDIQVDVSGLADTDGMYDHVV